jgi:hypothetical protein
MNLFRNNFTFTQDHFTLVFGRFDLILQHLSFLRAELFEVLFGDHRLAGLRLDRECLS